MYYFEILPFVGIWSVVQPGLPLWYVRNWTHESMGAPACTVAGEGVPNLVQPTMDTTAVTSLLLLHSFCLQL